MTQRRRTTRRKGERTGAIEVPEDLLNKIMRKVERLLVPNSEEDRVLAYFMERVPEVVRIPKRPFPSDHPEIFRDTWDTTGSGAYMYELGTYQIPGIRHGARRWEAMFMLRDARFDPGSRSKRQWGGYVGVDSGVERLSRSAQKRRINMALRSLGASRSEVPEEEMDALCLWTATMKLGIVAHAPFDTPFRGRDGLREIRSTFRHEIAHAMDESVRRDFAQRLERSNELSCVSDVAELTGREVSDDARREISWDEGVDEDSDSAWAAYYNLPQEVVARLTESVPYLTSIGAEIDLDKSIKTGGDAPVSAIVFEWAMRWSRGIRNMWPQLSETNRRRVLRAIYDMAERTISYSIARHRKPVIPNQFDEEE